MTRKNICTQVLSIGLLSLSACLGMTSCSGVEEEVSPTTVNTDDGELKFNPIVVGRNGVNRITRVDANNEEMTQVAIVAYEETINNTQSGVSFTKINGVWSGGGFNWNTDDGATSFCCISPSFNICAGSARTRMKFANRYFDYTLDPNDPQDFRVGVSWEVTKNSTNSIISPTMVPALAHMNFQVTNGLIETVIIGDIIIHNFASTGRFTYNAGVPSNTDWTIPDATVVANYRENFDPQRMEAFDDKAFVPGEDSYIAFIPQTPTFWAPGNLDDKSIAYADANNLAYIEVKCKIVNSDGFYLWGNVDNTNPEQPEWESLYLPFSVTARKWKANVLTGSYYLLTILFDGGYMVDGNLFEPHGVDQGISFTIPERMLFNAHVDNWVYDESELDF